MQKFETEIIFNTPDELLENMLKIYLYIRKLEGIKGVRKRTFNLLMFFVKYGLDVDTKTKFMELNSDYNSIAYRQCISELKKAGVIVPNNMYAGGYFLSDDLKAFKTAFVTDSGAYIIKTAVDFEG